MCLCRLKKEKMVMLKYTIRIETVFETYRRGGIRLSN